MLTPIHHKFIKAKLTLLLVVIAVFFITLPPICIAAELLKDSTEKMSTNEKQFCLSITEGLVSLDAQGADLRKILAKISERTGIEIEISNSVKDTVTISFHNLPLEEALKKITRNWGMIFSKERGQNNYQISRVVIVPFSLEQTGRTGSKTDDYSHIILPTRESTKPKSQATISNPQESRVTPTTIINEKLGIKSEVVPNEIVVRFKKDLSKNDIQAFIAKTGAIVKTHIEALNYYVLSLPTHLAVEDALRWYCHPVGEQLKYIVYFEQRPVACLAWSSAVRHIGCRDKFIGWSSEARRQHIHLMAYNSRFLILPWIRVRFLASHLLSRMVKVISPHWQAIYGHPVYYLETFVDKDRFAGTCYKAANWIYLGETTGRGKNDQTHKVNRSIKAVWGYPLCKDFHRQLNGGMP